MKSFLIFALSIIVFSSISKADDVVFKCIIDHNWKEGETPKRVIGEARYYIITKRPNGGLDAQVPKIYSCDPKETQVVETPEWYAISCYWEAGHHLEHWINITKSDLRYELRTSIVNRTPDMLASGTCERMKAVK